VLARVRGRQDLDLAPLGRQAVDGLVAAEALEVDRQLAGRVGHVVVIEDHAWAAGERGVVALDRLDAVIAVDEHEVGDHVLAVQRLAGVADDEVPGEARVARSQLLQPAPGLGLRGHALAVHGRLLKGLIHRLEHVVAVVQHRAVAQRTLTHGRRAQGAMHADLDDAVRLELVDQPEHLVVAVCH
jgi:hypothetical protein